MNDRRWGVNPRRRGRAPGTSRGSARERRGVQPGEARRIPPFPQFPEDDVHNDHECGVEKRDTAARSDQAPSLSCNPNPPGDEATRNRNDPARLAALKKLHQTLAASP